MMGEMHGPMFWGLDGSSMDDDFAFDLSSRTREEWDAEQRRSEEFRKQWDAEWEERERLGVTSSSPNGDGSNAIWSRSYLVDDTSNVPLAIRIFGIGCRLAELIVDLRDVNPKDSISPANRHHIDRLNRNFGNLREVLQDSDESLASSLVDPVINDFEDSLHELSIAEPDLAEKCEALSAELRDLLFPPAPEPTLDSDDFDVPF